MAIIGGIPHFTYDVLKCSQVKCAIFAANQAKSRMLFCISLGDSHMLMLGRKASAVHRDRGLSPSVGILVSIQYMM